MMRRFTLVLVLALGLAPPGARATQDCSPRLLVLSAFPGEIDALLTSADITHAEQANGRTFYVGTLQGHEVALALTGIGLVNARETTEVALGHFACHDQTTIAGIVFSGVSGGPRIGDVTVPADWTLDGEELFAADAAMLATATAIANDVALLRATPAGDPACVGIDPTLVSTVEVPHDPAVLIGGHGASSDGFEGRTLPCFPGAGDVFGCTPCRAPVLTSPDPARTAEHALPFVDPAFFFNYFEAAAPPPGEHVAVDMETAAVAEVAAREGIPFIAFRAASDGAGDPLGLPGFPFQFFYYRQLAAENAARTALAFLDAWGTG